MNRIKETLLDYRGKNKLTQTDMAKKLGCSRDLLACWETERSTPNLEMLIKIAETCNCNTDYLLGYSSIKINPRVEEHNIGNDTLTEIHATTDTLTEEQAKTILALMKAYLKEEKNEK